MEFDRTLSADGSSDDTAIACETVGRCLFSDGFVYRRLEKNCNFGPASNLGARIARGDFLIFLNNDTEMLDGWYDPLLADFATYPDLAATGPLLLYPPREPLGYTVQHLGVVFSLGNNPFHLYRGIPAVSPLARKRRFFQCITAACMMMRRSLFLEAGLFDERFVNGFEDVDLCLRLRAMGYRLTVNPDSRCVHHESQTLRRHAKEDWNGGYLQEKCGALMVPDAMGHYLADGLTPVLNAWLEMTPEMPRSQEARLAPLFGRLSFDALRELLCAHPFCEAGWRALVEKAGSDDIRLALLGTLRHLYCVPEVFLGLYRESLACGEHDGAEDALSHLVTFCTPWEEYVGRAESFRSLFAKAGVSDIANLYATWLGSAGKYRAERYEPAMKECWEIVRGRLLRPTSLWAYTLWRHFVDRPRRLAMQASGGDDGPAFSLLLSVHGPDPQHLGAAIDSVLAQDCPRWQLRVACDESAPLSVRDLLDGYAQSDPRIQVMWPDGNCGQAVDSALAMARYQWIALLDQDDLLAPDALSRVADAVDRHPDAVLFYSDEDQVNDDGCFFNPYCKPDKWDEELFPADNYPGRLCVMSACRLGETGGVRSADSHDMLLRLTRGCAPSHFVHIPFVLCHCRGRDDRHDAPGNRMEMAPASHRPVLPGPAPKVSLLVPFPADMPLPLLRDCVNTLLGRTNYRAFELQVIRNESENWPDRTLSDSRVRCLPCPSGCGLADRVRLGLENSDGSVLGILAFDIVPREDTWLEYLVSALLRDRVGAVGGKIVRGDGTLFHGGYLFDALGRLRPLLGGASATEPEWFSWNLVPRSVDALDFSCLFARRSAWERLGGPDPAMGEASAQDFCLGLGREGLRCVWYPFAEFLAAGGKEWPSLPENNTVFAGKWQGMKSCRTMTLENGVWSLAVPSASA